MVSKRVFTNKIEQNLIEFVMFFSYGYVNIPFMLLYFCKSHNLSSSCCKKLDLVVALYSQSLQRYFSPS